MDLGLLARSSVSLTPAPEDTVIVPTEYQVPSSVLEIIVYFRVCFVLKTVAVFLLIKGYRICNLNYTWRFKFPHSPDNWISSV